MAERGPLFLNEVAQVKLSHEKKVNVSSKEILQMKWVYNMEYISRKNWELQRI
jgi:hypothetical protein